MTRLFSSGLASEREEIEGERWSVTVAGASAQGREPGASHPLTMHTLQRR